MINNNYMIPQNDDNDKFNCYKVTEINNERFYQIPKSLFSEQYKDLNIEAKVIYAFLKDRMELSRKNNWVDDNGYIYLNFSQAEISKILNVSISTVSRAIKTLKDYKLIIMVRQGFNQISKIYICKIPTNPIN